MPPDNEDPGVVTFAPKAPEPVLGLGADRKLRKQVVLGKISFAVAIGGSVLLGLVLLGLLLFDKMADHQQGPAEGVCFLVCLLGGFLCVLLGYILGACANGDPRGEKAKTISLASLGGFVVLGLIVMAFTTGRTSTTAPDGSTPSQQSVH